MVSAQMMLILDLHMITNQNFDYNGQCWHDITDDSNPMASTGMAMWPATTKMMFEQRAMLCHNQTVCCPTLVFETFQAETSVSNK